MSGQRDRYRTRFLQGVAHFDAGRYWEAHESWEELWLEAAPRMHRFLQGLIQLAAAMHHVQRGTLRGSVRLIDAAMEKLRAFPEDYAGVRRGPMTARALRIRARVSALLEAGEDHRAGLEPDEVPRIELVPRWEEAIPEQWKA